MTKVLEVPPRAAALTESLRGMGYTLPLAVADIIDNSIAAGAKHIRVAIVPDEGGGAKRLTVCDDGCGMGYRALIQAMSLGSISPAEIRRADDLGRFGLGLKTASFSQCRKLTVVSKTEEGCFAFFWDLDLLVTEDKWYLQQTEVEPEWHEMIGEGSGTLVIWEKLDRSLGPQAAREVVQVTDRLRSTLRLIYHRFLEDEDFKLTLNGMPVKPWDPFFAYHPGKIRDFPEVSWPERTSSPKVRLRAFVVPDPEAVQAKITLFGEDDDLSLQGFFIYRGKRLISYGGWLGLRDLKKAPEYKLARIRVDFDNTHDIDWQLDIRKSTAKPPREVREWLQRQAALVRELSEKAVKARAPKTSRTALSSLWVKEDRGSAPKPNSADPVVATLYQAVAEQTLTEDLLSGYLEILSYAHPASLQQAKCSNPSENAQRAALFIYRQLRKTCSVEEVKEMLEARVPFSCWDYWMNEIYLQDKS